jgi:hypothetical protein
MLLMPVCTLTPRQAEAEISGHCFSVGIVGIVGVVGVVGVGFIGDGFIGAIGSERFAMHIGAPTSGHVIRARTELDGAFALGAE